MDPVARARISTAEWLYDGLYCVRGQAENLIKLHKVQLASDRTSCRSALLSQIRFALHTAYWLMLTKHDAILRPPSLRRRLYHQDSESRPLRLRRRLSQPVPFAAERPLAFLAMSDGADTPLTRLARPTRSRSMQAKLRHRSMTLVSTSDLVLHGSG